MKSNFSIIKFTAITFLIFILLDLFIGKYIHNKFIRQSFLDVDNTFAIGDDIYDHKFKPNSNTIASWGDYKYKFCTDSNGFRSSCEAQLSNLKEFDIGFIGDSFTEPVGLVFEESFVGIISENLKKKKIANLAVTSYSPSIYFAKINFLLSENYKFKEIIVFIDLSDILDDTVCYKLDDKVVVRRESFSNCHKNVLSTSDKINEFFKRRFKLSHEVYRLVRVELLSHNILDYDVPINITSQRRSDWTHDYKAKNYNNFSYEESTGLLLLYMNKLAELLRSNKIDLSIAVYPWPGTLKYDIQNNNQLKIWKNFCVSNCKKFYNFMGPFYDLLTKDKFANVYRKVYIENDVHFNKEGHRIIAEHFLKLYKN